LCLGKNIVTLLDRNNPLSLDLGRLLKPMAIDAAQKILGKIHVIKALI
jgi:hypothetical protein